MRAPYLIPNALIFLGFKLFQRGADLPVDTAVAGRAFSGGGRQDIGRGRQRGVGLTGFLYP